MIWVNTNDLLPTSGYFNVRRYSRIFYKDGNYTSGLKYNYDKVKEISRVTDDNSIFWSVWRM